MNLVITSWTKQGSLDWALDDNNQRLAKKGLVEVLNAFPSEVEDLLCEVREGRIDGSVCSGSCACLKGTVQRLRAHKYRKPTDMVISPSSPIERLFLGISKGDTPPTNKNSWLIEQWLVEHLDSRKTP